MLLLYICHREAVSLSMNVFIFVTLRRSKKEVCGCRNLYMSFACLLKCLCKTKALNYLPHLSFLHEMKVSYLFLKVIININSWNYTGRNSDRKTQLCVCLCFSRKKNIFILMQSSLSLLVSEPLYILRALLRIPKNSNLCGLTTTYCIRNKNRGNFTTLNLLTHLKIAMMNILYINNILLL